SAAAPPRPRARGCPARGSGTPGPGRSGPAGVCAPRRCRRPEAPPRALSATSARAGRRTRRPGRRPGAPHRAADLRGGGGVAAALALGAVDVDVGQELHVQLDPAGAVAARATQRTGVVGEVAGAEVLRA